MGLNYRWFSTMWGPYIFAGAAGSSMSLLVLVTTALRQAGYLKVVTLEHYHIMGNGCWPSPFSGLHRFQPIHAVLVRQYSRRNAVLSGSEYRVLVAAEHAPVIGRFFGPFSILLLQGIKNVRINFASLPAGSCLCRRSICI